MSAYPKKQFIDPEELFADDAKYREKERLEVELRLKEEDFQHSTLSKENLAHTVVQQSKLYSKAEARTVMSLAENVIWRRGLKAEYANIFFCILSFALVSGLSFSYPSTIGFYELGKVADKPIGIVLPYLLIFPLSFLVFIAYKLLNTSYVLGLSSLIKLDGFLKPELNCIELYYTNIGAIDIRRTFIQKILGLGDLIIHPLQAGSDMVIIEGINSPQQCKAVIDRRLDFHAKRKAGKEVPMFGDES